MQIFVRTDRLSILVEFDIYRSFEVVTISTIGVRSLKRTKDTEDVSTHVT